MLLLLCGEAGAAERKLKVAMLELRAASGVPQSTVNLLGEVIATDAARSEKHELMSVKDVAAVLSIERQSGPWQLGNGSYDTDYGNTWTAWADGLRLDLPAMPNTTCANWTRTDAGSSRNGRPWTDKQEWWAADFPNCDDPNQRLLCVEQ